MPVVDAKAETIAPMKQISRAATASVAAYPSHLKLPTWSPRFSIRLT